MAPDRRPVLLVVAHGTTRDAKSRAGGEGIAAAIAERLPTADVRACFLDDAPLLEDVAPTLPTDAKIVVVPWLLGGGGHFNDDIRDRLGDAFARARVLRPLGELPSLDDAVMSLVDDAALSLVGQAFLPVSPSVGEAVVSGEGAAARAEDRQAGMPVLQNAGAAR